MPPTLASVPDGASAWATLRSSVTVSIASLLDGSFLSRTVKSAVAPSLLSCGVAGASATPGTAASLAA